MFLGEGFDPVDGANRVRALTRAPNSRYASLRIDGRTVACGTIAFGHGWASIHGMRTEMAHRGQGFAARVLTGLALSAQARGIARVFLQVEVNNASAHALYLRAGFESAWRYRYWQPD
jgi:ribosomal protein S18 acetylase RimI-like enzyme